jgi:hypothetical protein
LSGRAVRRREAELGASVYVLGAGLGLGAITERAQIESSLPSPLSSDSPGLAYRALDGARGMPGVSLARRLVSGLGVACPKSRCPGCEPVALDEERSPGCPPRPAARASARSRTKIASLIRRFRQRKASLWVFPSAILRS